MKKAAFFLAVLMFMLCGCQGKADDTPVWYEIADGEAIITGDCGEATIQAYVEGCPVTRIGELAFYENTTCAEIVLPETLKTIDSNAFYRCSALREITIPASVCTIGINPFFRACSLKNIWVEEGNPNFRDLDGILYSKDGSTLLAYPEGREDTQYTVPDGKTAIADSAFGYHTALRYIQIPDSVVHLPDHNIFVYPDEITIIASADSAAALYAQNHGIALQNIPDGYKDILSDYQRLVQFRLSPDFEEAYTAGEEPALSQTLRHSLQDELAYKWHCMLIDLASGTEDANTFGYILYDMNQDGTPELFWVRGDRSVLAVFTLVGQEVRLLDAFWGRYECVVTASGCLYTRSSDAWNYSAFVIRKLGSDGLFLTPKMEFGMEASALYEVKNGIRVPITEAQYRQLEETYPFHPGTQWDSLPVYDLEYV